MVLAQQTLCHGQQLVFFAAYVAGVQVNEVIDFLSRQHGIFAGSDLHQSLAKATPSGFELPVLVAEAIDQGLDADGIRPGDGLKQGREEVVFFIRVMVDGRRIKVTHDVGRCLTGLLVASVAWKMLSQALQGIALVFYAYMTGGQHLERSFCTGGRR